MEHSFSAYTRDIWTRIRRSWSLDLRSLSLFRVGLALVILVDLALRARYLTEHYTDLGIFPRKAFFELWEGPATWSIHTASGELWFQVFLFAVHAFFALWLLLGYRTKISTIVLWILTVSLHNRNSTINSAADDLLRMLLFWSMFLPLDRHWSWDRNRYPKMNLHSLLSIGTAAFISQQIFLYWVTAYLKLWPEWYVTHSAVYEILSLETFRLPFGIVLYDHPSILRFLSGASMFVEFFGPLLFLSLFFHTWSRIAGILALVGLHLGIVTHIGVGIFPWISTVALLALLPSGFWDTIIPRWKPRGTAILYYDDHCGLCSRWVRILQNFWLFAGVKYTGLSEAPDSIQKLSAKHDMWVVTRSGKNFIGYGAFVELARQSWIGRACVIPLSWKPSRIIGDLVYRYASSKRKFCTIARPVPPAPPRKMWKIIGGIACALSLYSVLAMNVAVISCGRSWSPFFRAWPMSAVDLARERKLHVFETSAPASPQSGWIGKSFTAPRRPAACDRAEGAQFGFIEANPIVKELFAWHVSFFRWWTFLLRIDQYWGMFAPDPANTDYWLVIDAELTSRSHPSIRVHRDLWKDYALGSRTDGRVSLEKPNDLHTLSVSDRWRKYVYNILGEYQDKRYKQYFAESWCRRYNQTGSDYVLQRFTIYSMSQVGRPNYVRSEVRNKSVWQHCCLEAGCFQQKESTQEGL